MPLLRYALLLLASLTACHSLPDGPPATLVDLPWRANPLDEKALAARSLFEQGQQRVALARIDEVLAANPRHVDAQRLRQDLLRERGRRGRLWCEAEEALLRRPDDAMAHYLFGRIVADPERKLESFARAARLAPDSLWPWLGLAHTLRFHAPARSVEIYDRLYVASEGHPLVGIAYAAALREEQRHDEAQAIYRRLQAAPEVPGVGDLGLAQSLVAQDRRAEAWPALLAALRQRPHDPAVQGLLRGWILAGASQDQVAQVFDVLREDPGRVHAFGGGDGETLLAELLLRMLQPQAALSLLEAAHVSARQPLLRRLQRRLLLALGETAAFLNLVRTDVPAWLVGAEQNQLRGRWLTLLHGPWHAGEPLASVEQSVGLLEALRGVGWLVEVETLAAVALRRWPDCAAPLVALRDEARRELAFEAGVRRLLYQGYEAGDRGGLQTVLDQVRELSQRLLGNDVVGDPVVFSVPMVGEMLDPFTGGLAEHFARYNRHFVLGRRSGGTAEGMLFTRLSLRELPAQPELALPARCFEVVGIDRDVRALAGVLGGDIAGVALLNHFLVDFDAVREWARTVADRRRIAVEDGLALCTDPLPRSAGEEPLDVAWRLALASPVQDNDLDAAVLDTIRQHERQHLVDSFHYLPVEDNLWRSLGLLFQFGLSPSAIEAEMERRAELAALAVSTHTELVLAHIADFLGEPGADSPHHEGFAELGRQVTAELQALGVSAEGAAPSRWHTVDRGLVRQAAQRLLARLP